MAKGEYSVFEFLGEGEDEVHVPVLRFVDAETAVKRAVELTLKPSALIGITTEVRITDGGDHCAWHWVFGKGLVFPTKEDAEAARDQGD
jgi:hypothetical protein